MTVVHDWISDELLRVNYSGDVTGQELLDSVMLVGEDVRMEKLRYIIADWSTIKDAQITADDIRQLAAYILALSKSFPGVKNVSVVSDYESGQARASFYEFLAEESSWVIGTCASYQEALDWCYAKNSD
ncbi:hypothetical protein [Aliikangiella sp. IMCC44359]|uniref:hypothetical protein n=1 Tax=Aliikangiella sp. IMCC44359 TaxID=3459125 RepID=UPI00403B3509